MTGPTSDPAADAADLAEVLAVLGRYWANLRDVAYAPLTERLSGYAHSFLVALEGSGGADQHRLSPKTAPDVDVVASYPHEKLGAQTIADPHVAELIAAIRSQISLCAGAFVADPTRDAVGAFIADLCRLVADQYTLHRLRWDDDTDSGSEGADFAGLLPDAFADVWKKGW